MKTEQKSALVLTLVVGVGLGAGCASRGPFIPVDAMPEQAFDAPVYRIVPGDLLTVSVWNQPKMSIDVRVRPDGRVTLPLVGDVVVLGLTPEDCAQELERRLDGLVVDPKVNIILREVTRPTVSVVGEVRNVGDYPLDLGDNVLQVLARAGGLTEFAKPDRIYVLRKTHETQRVLFTYDQLVNGRGRALAFRLQDGDIIVVE